MRAWSLLALCLALSGAAAAVPFVRDTWQQDGVRDFARRVAPAGPDPYNCKAFNFTQRVDHFDRRNTRTFLQRYYVCDGLWRNRAPGSREPLFVYFGECLLWCARWLSHCWDRGDSAGSGALPTGEEAL